MPDLKTPSSTSGSSVPTPTKPPHNGIDKTQSTNGAAEHPVTEPVAPYKLPPIPSTSESVSSPQPPARPRSLRMILRFWRTNLFALWLFGRVIFWQLLVRRWFPGYVNRTSSVRYARYAHQFRKFAISMGGVMIKLGQFVSTRVDVLPEAVIRELASLQDEVPTIDFDRIRSVIERELGSVEARYQRFDPNPIAAASLGQVHRAQLHNGERVVVKVQRPGIRDLIYTDMAAVRVVARVAMWFGFIRRRADTVALADEFGRVLFEEISYHQEARNAARFARIFRHDMGVYVPTVYREHSTDYILTIEDVTSIKITDFAAMVAAGISRKAVARRLMDTYLKQVFEDRFFHADPHPGNLFVYPLPVEDENVDFGEQGRPFYLIFVDFGMTGELTDDIRQGVADTMIAIVQRDARKLVAGYEKLGFLLPGADKKRIVEATQMAFDEVWGMSMTEIGDVDFDRVLEIGSQFTDLIFDMPFRVPQDFIYLGRTFGILSGMATQLDPEFNPWHELQPYAQRLATQSLRNYAVDALLRPLWEAFLQGPRPFFLALQNLLNSQLPATLRRTYAIFNQLAEGELEIVATLSPRMRRQFNRIEAQSRRTTRAVLFGSFLIASTMLYTSGEQTLALVGYGISGILLLMLVFTRNL